MTRERAQELMPVLQAWADGRVIQWYNPYAHTWMDCIAEPSFENESKFRIKPEPRRFWAVRRSGLACGGYLFDSKESADTYATTSITSVVSFGIRDVVEVVR